MPPVRDRRPSRKIVENMSPTRQLITPRATATPRAASRPRASRVDTQQLLNHVPRSLPRAIEALDALEAAENIGTIIV